MDPRESTLARREMGNYSVFMRALHVETTCTEEGVIILRDLPVHPGDCVEVVVMPRSPSASGKQRYPLRGEPLEYVRPFDPVAENDWEAAT